MRLVFTSDLHGRESAYRELEALLRRRSPDLLILGGDLLPLGSPAESIPDRQRRFIDRFWKPWLESCPCPVAAVPGNADLKSSVEYAGAQISGALFWPGYPPSDPGFGVPLTGYPYLPPTPFTPKDYEKRDRDTDIPESANGTGFISHGRSIHWIAPESWWMDRPSIESDLKQYTSGETRRSIWVSHSPPWNTALDRLSNGRAAGSRAIRRWIETTQPLVGLHGHIHESPARTGKVWHRLGDSICFNPGQTDPHRISVLCLTLEENRVHSLWHSLFGEIHPEEENP